LKKYEEIYNPYIKPFLGFKLKIEELTVVNKGITADLEWLKLNNLEDLSYNIAVLSKKKDTKQKEVKELREMNSKKIEDLKILDQKIKSHFSPQYYFSGSQKTLRLERKTLISSVDNLSSILVLKIKSKTKLNAKINKFQSDIKRYTLLNLQSLKEESEKNIQFLKRLTQEANSILIKKNKVASKLKPITDELSRIDLEIEKTNSIIVKAQNYNAKLDNAFNARERAIIHQECKHYLGDGKPNNIIRRNSGLIKMHQRDLEKLLVRAKKISDKVIRKIDTVVIDGNNMTYENSKFIGIKALLSSTQILEKDYKVIVIFDSEIRSMLKKSSRSISEEFGDFIKIHIVASKQKADETILDLVSGKLNSYVVSNDRFSDYFDKEAVKNKRILRHEIIDNSIFIHDLDLRTTF
jgi:hypothetical protein